MKGSLQCAFLFYVKDADLLFAGSSERGQNAQEPTGIQAAFSEG